MHFFRTKEWMEEKYNDTLPISDASMARLLQDTAELSIIYDEPYRWCLRYAQYMEADRFLSREEKALSIFNIYMAIIDKDEKSLQSVFDALRENDDPAGTRLLIALNGFLEEKEVER